MRTRLWNRARKVWPILRRAAVGLAGMLVIAGQTAGVQCSESTCDNLREESISHLLTGLPREISSRVRDEIEGSRVYWLSDPTYRSVRAEVDRVEASRSSFRVEFGGEPGRRYGSLWFIDKGEEVIEFATGIEIEGVKVRTFPRDDWLRFESYVSNLSDSDLATKLNPDGVDLPVYFICGNIRGKAFAFLLSEFPSPVPQFRVLRRALALSKLRATPREIRDLTGGD